TSQEQYMDFVTNRRFRSSILTKQGNAINRNLAQEQILNYHLLGHMACTQENPDLSQPVDFNTMGGGTMTSREPATTALFLEMAAARPLPVHATELIARAQQRLQQADDTDVKKALLDHGM